MEKKDAEIKVEQTTEAVVEAAKINAEAVELARKAQADLIMAESENRNIRIMSESLRRVFGEHEDSGRFIDVSKIPLICKSIEGIFQTLIRLEKKIDDSEDRFVNQDQFSPVQKVVYGLISLILLGVFGALIALVIK